ncbi:MAG TPA: Uma2 family endonuclease [Pirellulales bacterium]|jgi:Uma2 family endonuclease|nr:Uma2 family endonuclease [Pirellulales bacterium]
MAQVESPPIKFTLVDLSQRFGAMPAWRIRTIPAPGAATEEDVIAIEARENRLCELVDGVLVEKTVGYWESYLACELVRELGNFVKPRNLGIVTGEGGMMRLFPGMVRIPDAAFARREKFPDRRVPREPIPSLVPDLAVEVLSESNTVEEMSRKLADYFDAGVRLVWYVDPRERIVRVFTAPEAFELLRGEDVLTGGEILPGFALSLRDLFREPLAGDA